MSCLPGRRRAIEKDGPDRRPGGVSPHAGIDRAANPVGLRPEIHPSAGVP